MLKKYGLEVYAPDGGGDDAIFSIESDEPFAPIQKGDLLNPRTWGTHSHTAAQAASEKTPHGTLLCVTGIEHFILERDGGFVQHKLGIFTEAIDDVRESRPKPIGQLAVLERWILSNQLRILERLYPDEADSLAENREAIEKGYELHYGWCHEHIYDAVFTEGECKQVLTILSMFEALKLAYDRLQDKAGIEERRVKFAGFDGNNESSQMAYAGYFCKHDGGRYKTLNIKDLNSHAPLLGLYRAMVKEWKKSANEHELTRDDIVRITSAKAAGRC